jgi:peptidylprolyl isomerase
MQKPASLAMILLLAAPLGACGSSDDEPDEPGAKAGRLSLQAPPDVASAPADAEVTDSGLASKRLIAGTGTDRPSPSDTVRVDYVGWTPDGMKFDDSEDGPAEFEVSGVIDGWTEGLQLMVVGEVRRLWIPSELAYGDNARAPRPAGDLVFDVDLLDILTP